jgi:hypothetical protein
MSTTPPEPGNDPSFVNENALRIASESLTRYDETTDTYHCSYGPPIPGITVHDTERDLLVRIDPGTRQVIGFTIPNFRAWYAAHADEDGSFDVELPSIWGGEPDGQ